MKSLSVLCFAISTVMLAHSAWAASLEWIDNSDNEDGFIVEKKNGATFTEIGKPPKDATTFTVTLAPGETACYRLFAYNAAGKSEPSNEACGTMPTLPGAPTDAVIKLKMEISGEITVTPTP